MKLGSLERHIFFADNMLKIDLEPESKKRRKLS